MLKNIMAGIIVVSLIMLILTLPCWAEPTVDELYGKKYGNDLALGKVGDLITGNDKHPGRGLALWDIITDGDLCKSGANQCYTQVGAGGLQWIQLDLGEKIWIDTVVIWHWYIDGRTYNHRFALGCNGSPQAQLSFHRGPGVSGLLSILFASGYACLDDGSGSQKRQRHHGECPVRHSIPVFRFCPPDMRVHCRLLWHFVLVLFSGLHDLCSELFDLFNTG